MTTLQPVGFRRTLQWPRRALVLVAAALALAACGAPANTNEEPRYPEKRRPPPLRSASDGEVMGANGQAPEDTLEASATNLHAAPGWQGEKGAVERAREADCAAQAAKAKNANASDAANASEPNADAAPGRPRSERPCPKPER